MYRKKAPGEKNSGFVMECIPFIGKQWEFQSCEEALLFSQAAVTGAKQQAKQGRSLHVVAQVQQFGVTCLAQGHHSSNKTGK